MLLVIYFKNDCFVTISKFLARVILTSYGCVTSERAIVHTCMVIHASSFSADSSLGPQNFVACYDIHKKPKTTHITAIHIKFSTSKV